MNTESILNAPDASNWLKKAIKESRDRDVIDALKDAEALVRVLEAKLDAMIKRVA